jgi:hypothetical protein
MLAGPAKKGVGLFSFAMPKPIMCMQYIMVYTGSVRTAGHGIRRLAASNLGECAQCGAHAVHSCVMN